jgi:hypothetical protein
LRYRSDIEQVEFLRAIETHILGIFNEQGSEGKQAMARLALA